MTLTLDNSAATEEMVSWFEALAVVVVVIPCPRREITTGMYRMIYCPMCSAADQGQLIVGLTTRVGPLEAKKDTVSQFQVVLLVM